MTKQSDELNVNNDPPEFMVPFVGSMPLARSESFSDQNDVDHKVIFAPTRTGMGASMILPQVLDQADGPKR